jgi:hypothetical protein
VYAPRPYHFNTYISCQHALTPHALTHTPRPCLRYYGAPCSIHVAFMKHQCSISVVSVAACTVGPL